MRKKFAWLVTLGLVASALAIPGLAAADTTQAVAQTGGMTLNLLGVGPVQVTLDDFGNINSVAIDTVPVDPASASPHRVRFDVEADGTRIAVDAKKSKLSARVKAGSLADLLGIHQWSALLFPDDPADTMVSFAVGQDAAGNPTISGVAVDGTTDGNGTTAGGATFEVRAGDAGGHETQVAIVFTKDGYTKTLKIKIHVDDDDDAAGGEPTAVLKVELRAKDRQRVVGAIESFIDPYVWQGLLCDGTEVTVPYSIDTTSGVVTPGDVTFNGVAATEGFTIANETNGFEVRFDDSRARLRVKFRQKEDGTWELKVDSKTTETCRHDGADVKDGEANHDGDAHRSENDKNGRQRDHDGKDRHDRGQKHDD